MPATFNWQGAVHDPRFWTVQYSRFSGVTREESLSYTDDEYDFLQKIGLILAPPLDKGSSTDLICVYTL